MERAPCSHWIRGWMGLGFNLDAVEKRKMLNYHLLVHWFLAWLILDLEDTFLQNVGSYTNRRWQLS
jgi:hypothetical protein